jgi:hypothetical protein
VARVNTTPAYRFDIEVRGKDIIVSLPSARFTAVYYKPAGQPQLILRQRSKCDDRELLAHVSASLQRASVPATRHETRPIHMGNLVRAMVTGYKRP